VRDFIELDGVAFRWKDVVAIQKSTGSSSPRGSWVYLKNCMSPILLDFTHSSIVEKWKANSKEGQ
jgi:hypothetical protein